MSRTLRNVASSEPNAKLQDLIFMYAKKQELLQLRGAIFADCEVRAMKLLEESRSMLLNPMQVRVG